MDKKKFINKKSVVGLSLATLIFAGSVYGIKSKAGFNTSSSAAEAYATGLEAASAEDRAWFEENTVIIDSAEDYYDLMEDGELTEVYNDEDAKEKEEKDSEYDTTLRSFVDNSDSKYFPEIKTQGTVGSCVSWANVYYTFTYTYNKYNDIESKGDNIFSPTWTYTQCAASIESVTRLLVEKGAVKVSDVPIVTDNSLYDNNTFNLFDIYPDEILQTNAINYRLAGIYKINTPRGASSPDSSTLIPIKTALNNGELLTFTTNVGAYNLDDYKIEYDEDNELYHDTSNKNHEGEIICCRCDKDGSGQHCMTLVGYDDNIWVDINKNGIKEVGEMGAFKIANSWGKKWGNGGFLWVSYDAINNISSVRENSAITLKITNANPFNEITGFILKQKKTEQYIQFNIKFSKEMMMHIEDTFLIASDETNEYKFRLFGGQLNVYAEYSGVNSGILVFPLDNAVEDVDTDNLLNYNWKLRINDYYDGYEMNISDVKIVDKASGKVYKNSINKPLKFDGGYKDIDINMSDVKESNSAIIYYSGYNNPNIHYCIAGGNWTNVPGIAMERTSEQAGYTHKYTIDLKNSDSVTVCFNDGNNSWDSNNGKNYIFEKGIYTYKNGNISKIGEVATSDKFEAVLKTDKYGAVCLGESINVSAKAYGTENEVLYRFGYIDKESGTETIVADYSSNDNVNISFENAGKYHLFVDVKDNNGNYIRKYNYNYAVENPVVKSLSFDLYYPQRMGTTITIKAETLYIPEGAEAVGVIKDSEGNEKTIGKFNKNQIKWTPDKKGIYTIIARIIKGNDILSEMNFEKYKVISDDTSFHIEDVEIHDMEYTINSTVTGRLDVYSGVAPYRLEIGYIENGNKVFLKTFGSESFYIAAPSTEGTVRYYARINDAVGAVAYKEFEINYHKFIITDISVNPKGKVYAGETVTFNITTKYEKTYKYGNARNITITNKKTGEIENYTYYSNNISWTPEKAGNYTVECRINSYMTGTDTYTFDYKVYNNPNDDELYIDSVDTNIESPAKTGDAIYFDVNRVNEVVDDNNYIVYKIKNTATGDVETLTDYIYKDDNRVFWIPDKAGIYEITVEFYQGEQSAEYEIEYEVKEIEKNTVTIYYKGFSTPYIHYQVAGNWTNVPGIAMTPDTSMTGYTHKAVIELPEGETAITACFNDGNNSWDSNNGKNYTFTLGDYTYSNGVIKRIGETSDTTTIYYSGYSTPYIHYNINGVWTNVPGVAMEATSEENGYTHKAVIDMSDADTLIACFNDGRNNWDSNYGQNYTFGVGTYYYKNGQITAK